MRLVERYALATGLKIGSQYLLEQFFPLPFSRYITLHASSGMAAKNYAHYAEVVALLKPYLSARGIEILQMGGKDDLPIPGCYDNRGKDNVHQGSYLIRGALLHLGNDSVWGHRAGYLGVPLVQPWGPTTPQNHSSYEHDPAKTVFMESHRWGRKATFASQENPLSIGLVDPCQMAREVLRLLDIPNTITRQTQFIGTMYPNLVIEWIPNAVVNPGFNPDAPLVARMDKHHDEAILVQTLQTGRKVHLFCKQPLANLDLLNVFKANLLSYSHELTIDCPIQYVRTVKAVCPKTAFFSRLKNGDELNALRFHFIDFTMIEQATESTREDYVRESAKYLNEPEAKTLDRTSHTGILEFKTNKYVLSQGQVYLSHAHLAANQPTTGDNTAKVLDTPEFWLDLHHLMVYTP